VNAASFLPSFHWKKITWKESPSQVLSFLPKAALSITGKEKTDHEAIFNFFSHLKFYSKELPYGCKHFGDENFGSDGKKWSIL